MRQLLEIDRRLAPFTIIDMEEPYYMPYDIHVGDQSMHTKIGGIIDRVDCVTDPLSGHDRIRVIDYKTAARLPRPMADMAAVFDPAQIPNHSDYYLQAMLYSHIVRQQTLNTKQSSPNTPVSPSLLFIQHAAAENYDATLRLGREPVIDIAPYSDQLLTMLRQTIDAIFNPDLPFTPTADRDRCRHCPYAELCRK